MTDRLTALRATVESTLPQVDGVVGLKTGPAELALLTFMSRSAVKSSRCWRCGPRNPSRV
jgi:hypothetical protein